MTIKKHQLGVRLRPVLILFTLMILLQTMGHQMVPVPAIHSALPKISPSVFSPITRDINLLCPLPLYGRRPPPAHCPCRQRPLCFTLAVPRLPMRDAFCSWQRVDSHGAYQNTYHSAYRFSLGDGFKKRLKRAIRRLLRLNMMLEEREAG